MTTAIAQPTPLPKMPVPRQPRRISKEQFLREYSDREDGYKYEWNNGIIEKTDGLSQRDACYQVNMTRSFIKTQAFQNGGILVALTDMETLDNRLRRPDISYYSAEQQLLMKLSINQVAPWVAEVISPNDQADKINEKTEEYFRAGVQVVWNIYPASQKVDVFTSVDDVKICRGKTVCSGAPALPDFEITAEELFA